MSTRCIICRLTADGVQAIYCHYDGYPEYAGAVLAEHYQTPESRDELFALGDLYALGKTPETCEAYGRDHGEAGTEARMYVTLQGVRNTASKLWAEWIYCHDGDEWLCAPVAHDRDGVFSGKFGPLISAANGNEDSND